MLETVPAGVKVSELQYPTRDGSYNRLKLFQPTQLRSGSSPFIMLIHGGGFCLGSPEGEEQTCRNLVLTLEATCVAISYRLAPEFPFPYAPNDCWDALQWCAGRASSWGADTAAGFVVGGTSAGANLAAVVIHLARDGGLSPPITGHYLGIPLLCPEDKIPDKYKPLWVSHEQNKASPILPQAAIDMFMGAYMPDHEDTIRFAIFNHPLGHGKLPPTYFQVDGMDPLRDDGIIYERVLREEFNIATRIDIYPGLPHGHWSFLPTLKASQQARKDQLEGIGWLLGKTPDLSKINIETSAATV